MNIDLTKTQKYLEWVKRKLYLDAISQNAKHRVVKRGQVYWCDFGIGIGSEMSKETPRPCVVLQQTTINIKSPNTIVVPITHDDTKLPCLIPIREYYSSDQKLILDGQANVSNITCISKARLGDFIVQLSNDEVASIEKAIMIQLGVYGKFKEMQDKIQSKNEYISKIKAERNAAQDELHRLKNQPKN